MTEQQSQQSQQSHKHIGPVALAPDRRFPLRSYYIAGIASDPYQACRYSTRAAAQAMLETVSLRSGHRWRLERSLAPLSLYAAYQCREDAESTLAALHHPNGWRIVEAPPHA